VGVTGDPEYLVTTFVVIDFEATTPKGARPEPIEVAALAVRAASGGGLAETARFCELIQPPPHAPVTPRDTAENGLRPADVARARPAGAVLADLDLWLAPPPCLLVAHNAHVEAGLLYDYREHCPRVAVTAVIDTVKLARSTLPGLISYGLDHLMLQLSIPRPPDRHRAMPDVVATAELLRRLLGRADQAGLYASLGQLTKAVALTPRASQPRQEALF
jgi:DNA polymerase III epsilon subunit-like protein